jgi:hypothetical protein
VALCGLAFAGHIAALSLIDAPPFAVYQHYWPWSRLFTEWPAGVFVLAIQAVVCLWLGYRARRDVIGGIRQIAPRWWLPLAGGFLAFSSAIPTESVGRFAGEVLLACGIIAVAALNYVLIVWRLPSGALWRIQFWLADKVSVVNDGRVRPWDRRVPLMAAGWVLIVSSTLAVLVFERVPHIDDSIAYLFQAKYISTGALWLPRPPDPESFAVAHLVVDGDKWYSKFFPGWPAVLSIGVVARLPWLINPLLAAASVLLTHTLVRRMYGSGTAHAVALLISASPWLLFLSGSLMAHAVCLFWLLMALVAVDCQRGRPLGGWAPVAGVSLGMLFLTRPFDAALVGPVVGLWALGFGARRLSFGALVAVGGSAVLVASLYFLYNLTLTGDPFVAPHQLWSTQLFGAGIDVLGFGPNVGTLPWWHNIDPLPGHGLADVVLNTNKNFSLVSFELFGWAFGSLAVASVALQPGGIRRSDSLMIGILLAVIGGHAWYWAPGGPDFGARYWYLVIVPLAVLTVRGTESVVRRLAESGGDWHRIGGRMAAFISLASLSAMVIVVPWRAMSKYDRYRGIGREFQEIADQRGISDALVFVRSPRRSDYQAAFTFNPPALGGKGNIFVRDTGGEPAAAVLRHLPNRMVWVVGRESETAPKLDVIAGPLPPGTMPPGLALTSAQTFQAIVR